MTCQECELFLAGDEEALVEDHLHGCARCRAIQEELRANTLALSSLREDDLPRVKTSKPWIAAAAAAILLALILHRSPHPQQVTPPVTGPIKVTAQLALAPAPALKPAVRRTRKPARRNAEPEQPLLVKMLTPDPDVVVYWLVD